MEVISGGLDHQKFERLPDDLTRKQKNCFEYYKCYRIIF